MSDLFNNVLRGEITRIIYEKPDGNYTVLRILPDDGVERTAVGPISGIAPGMNLEMTGRWEKHNEYGRQFRAVSYRPVLPATRDGLIRFLGSGAIPGIGQKTAQQIVAHFGADTLNVLNHEPHKLRDVPKIGKKKAALILQAWQESAAQRDTYIFLQGLGITPAYCKKLFSRYGSQAVDVIRANPYRLAQEVDGIGFLKADAIAKEVGIAADSPERMTAAAVYTMNQETGNGHVCLPEEYFVKQISQLTGQISELAVAGIDRAVARRMLVRLDGMLYSPQLAKAETMIPQLIRALNEPPGGRFAGERCMECPGAGKFQFNEGQKTGIRNITRAPLCIITGGPGVGKTTVLSEIVRRAKHARLRIAAAAPTGRAAKRLSESTGITGKTLHRLLVFDPATGRFGYDECEPLPYDLVIVDEASMIDIMMALALLRAIKPGTSLLLVGDKDQLPSVGPGQVLRDLIGSGQFLTVNLTEVYRQAEGSRIIRNAHRINRGALPEKNAPQDGLSDFYWIEQDDPDRAVEMILRMNVERIPQRFGLDPVEDVQILTPMNRGNCGTIAINQQLQSALNGGDQPSFTYGERVFKRNDKVMQTSNNYDKQVFNGDLGRIVAVESGKKRFQVLFEGSRMVEYSFEEADQLTAAYAITVHKSQGSEFPAVILPMLSQHYMMLQRNLLYTAVTRARKLLVLIGSRKALEMAVGNTRLAPRYSRLAERLADLPQPEIRG